MIPDLRQLLNSRFTDNRYRALLHRVDELCGVHVEFRISETPVFFPSSLIESAANAGREILQQLVGNREYHDVSDKAIPAEFRVPGEDSHPLFFAADFGITRDSSGSPLLKLIEMQGFPSLYAYQNALVQSYKEVYELPERLTSLPGGMERRSYEALFRRAVLGGHDPSTVVLMEIDPEHQKTRADFLLTEKICGIRTVDIRYVKKEGRQLFYRHHGSHIPIRRIYNRAIADELVKTGAELPFSFTDDIDVEWAGHPNWFFRLSKFSLPYLDHPTVPKTIFLSELERMPDDLDQWVLKPLFSFAGSGVVVGPSREALDAIPTEKRSAYVLQERVDYVGVVETPHGPTKAELRILFIWLDTPLAVNNIIRMGRGKMMGVDHNRNMAWVGSSAGLFVP